VLIAKPATDMTLSQPLSHKTYYLKNAPTFKVHIVFIHNRHRWIKTII